MTTIAPPNRTRGSSFLHRRHSSRLSVNSTRTDTSSHQSINHSIFEGTDTLVQNRKVALQRVVEAHEALELKAHSDENTRDRHDSASIDGALEHDFYFTDLPDGEVRAFRYFLRKWDRNTLPDTEFDLAVEQCKTQFEETTIRHFFRRIRYWDETEEVLQAAKQEVEKRSWRRKKDSMLTQMWLKEKERQEQEHNAHDELKEITTREGLAQLLWTLMHGGQEPLAPELFAECTHAVKRMYGIKC